MKPKILFIMHMPPPVHGAAMVGQYIHDSKLINGAYDCYYINLSLAKDLKDIGKGGVRKTWDFVRQLYAIRQTVAHIKPDLCYVTPNAAGGAFYKDYIVVQMLKGYGRRIVIHYHNKGVRTRQDRFVDNILYKRFFEELTVILLAKSLYEDVKKYVPMNKVYFCPNGIPEESRKMIRSNHCQSIPHLLFLSNLLVNKGILVLLDACKILQDQGYSFVCECIGGETSEIDADHFVEEVNKRGLEQRVAYHGKKYGEEKIHAFENSDIFVLPSFNECFPLVLLEAMEYGLPCISTAEGGICGIIDDGKTGYIIEKKNAVALADKIAFLIDHPDIRKEMGENGRKKFKEQFTLSIFENRMKEILSKCLISREQS